MTDFLSTPHAERLVVALLHFLWQGTLICLLYPVAVNLNLVRTSRSRYLFGVSLFCLMALCPVLTFWSLGPATVPQVFPPDETVYTVRTTQAIPETGLFGINFPLTPIVLTCWLAGVVVLSLRLLGGYRQLRRWRRGTLELPPALGTQISALCRRIGLRRIPEVKLSKHVTEAMAFGFWKPVILLPVSWATELPVSTLEAIIAHELAHIRRFDLWVNLGQRFVETMLFYHPAVWWLSNRIRDEREFCCDEMAARATGESLGYALALEGVARYLAGSRTLLGTSFLGDGKMKLLKRVRHVLGQSSSANRKLWWPAGILALMLPIAIFGTSLTAQDAPREEDRPRAEREEGRRRPAPERDRPREGDRQRTREEDRDRPRDDDRERPRGERDRPPREGDRPLRDGDRPRGERGRPRDGDGPPRDGDRPRPPREGDRPPRDGDRPPRGDRERGERDLYREIELLREEVRQLREELRRRPAPPPPRGAERPRPLPGAFPPQRDGDRPPRADDRLRGEGDQSRGEPDRRPRFDRDIPEELRRREPDRPPGEGDRPRRDGDRRRPS